MKSLIPGESVINKILVIRNQKVILDRDLAVLYNVETRVLKQAVRRNIRRFPKDFMFELTTVEYTEYLRSQFGTLAQGKYSKYLPYAFLSVLYTSIPEYLSQLKAQQKQNKFWDESGNKLYDTALALLAVSFEDSSKTNAKKYLLTLSFTILFTKPS